MNFLLYDTINKKNIKIDKLDIETKKIIDNTFIIKNDINKEFIKVFSDDKTHIPLFDLNNESIKFVKKNFVYKAIKQNHFRIINKDITAPSLSIKFPAKVNPLIPLPSIPLLIT